MYYFLVLIMGLTIGSFLNVVIYRLPRENLSVIKPTRSFCPNCKTQIKWFDNIPVFSWLILNGRCRKCENKISIRYPFVELLTGLLAVLIYHKTGFSLLLPIYFYFVAVLLVTTAIDLELTLIYVPLLYIGIPLAFIAAYFVPRMEMTGPWLYEILRYNYGLSDNLISLIGSALGYILGWGSLFIVALTYKILRNKDGMGGGDLPLHGFVGAFLGWRAIPIIILFSSILGLLGFLLLKSLSNNSENKNLSEDATIFQKAIPFGPFISLAAFLYYIAGEQFLTWYLGFFI